MPNQKHVQNFLGRLESTIHDKGSYWETLRAREAHYSAHHHRNKTCPGKDYMFMGQSQNSEHKLVGTEMQHRRKTCIDLLIEAKGNEHHCVRLDTALNFEGFDEVLSRFERDLLSRLPAHTMIGPAYDEHGTRLGGAFTVWRALCEDRQHGKVLIGV